MSNTIAYVDNQTLTNIADAVRYKTGTNGKMLLNDIPDKIRNIEGIIPSGSIEVTENGTYNISEYASAVVDVPVKTLISESVLAVDKTSETVHENYWVENYLPEEQEPDALYVIEFENNNAPNYVIEKMIVCGSRGSGLDRHTGCLIIRRDNGVNKRYIVNFQDNYNSQQHTCAASIGTVIKVYKLRYTF